MKNAAILATKTPCRLTGEQAVKTHASSVLALWTKREIKLMLNWSRIRFRIKEKVQRSLQEPFLEKAGLISQGICPFPETNNKTKVKILRNN